MATRERSPNYPAHSLPEVIEFARMLYQAEKRASVPMDAAARALGYTSLSGRARVKISSMRKFGLITETQGRLRLSDDAMRILFEKSPQDRQEAINVAAFRPDIFKELAGNEEASDATLTNDLVRDGYSQDGARAVVTSFRETMSVVSSSPIGYDEPESEGEPMIETAGITSGSTGPGLLRQFLPQDPHRHHSFAFTPPGGQRVELRIDGGPWTPEARTILQDYFDLVEKLLATDAVITAAEATVRALSPTVPEPPDEQSPDAAPESASQP